MRIIKHKLEKALYRPTPNHGGTFAKKRPDTIVIHYTATATARQAVDALSNPRVKASAHVVIDRDGTVTQLLPFDTVAWHAGESRHLERTRLNKYSIGIEIVNAGWLRKSGEIFLAQSGREYTREEVIYAVHRNSDVPYVYWHKYTEEQLRVTEEVCALLIGAYPVKWIVGHEEIAPERKQDPGPAFPLDDLRRRLLGVGFDLKDDKGATPRVAVVTAGRLNIRGGPSIKAGRVARPLPRGQQVEILQHRGNWVEVETRIRGWVHKDYISPKKGET